MDPSERFYKLIWPHAPTLLRLAQSLCRNSADAEDLAQETLAKAFRHLDQFQDGTDAKSWLMRILRNTRIDRIRSQVSRRGTLSLDDLPGDVEAPEIAPADHSGLWHDPKAMLEALSDQQLVEMLLELPEEIRWSLLLVDVEGLEMKDAAEIMEVPTGTVKSRLHRGRQMLRQKLEPIVTGSKS
jgi:RNA polymerase sigma-70 factor, ECF subfamily